MRYAILTAVLGVALEGVMGVGGAATARTQGDGDAGMTPHAWQHTDSMHKGSTDTGSTHTGPKTSALSKAPHDRWGRPKVYGKLHYGHPLPGHPLPRYARPLPKEARAPWGHHKAHRLPTQKD